MRTLRVSLRLKPGLTAALGFLCLFPLSSFGREQARPSQTNYSGVNIQEVPGSVKKLPGLQQSPGPTSYPGVYVQEVPSGAGQVPGVGHAQSAIVTDPRMDPAATDYARAENRLYRVEIHGKGTGNSANSPTATLKWSRDNGSAVSAGPQIFTLDPASGRATFADGTQGRTLPIGPQVVHGSYKQKQTMRAR